MDNWKNQNTSCQAVTSYSKSKLKKILCYNVKTMMNFMKQCLLQKMIENQQ